MSPTGRAHAFPLMVRLFPRVIGMNPDRVAMYSYAHVPWMKKQQGSFARHLPEGREKFRLFEVGVDIYASAGVTDGRGAFGYVVYVREEQFERAADALGV